MNLPNKLTVSRLVLTVFFLLALFIDFPFHFTVALVFFVAASLTDLFDGIIARRRNLITAFGKLMDPLADKVLICSAFIAFIELEWMAAWMVILIVARELAITGLRLLAASKNLVLAAERQGKKQDHLSDHGDHRAARHAQPPRLGNRRPTVCIRDCRQRMGLVGGGDFKMGRRGADSSLRVSVSLEKPGGVPQRLLTRGQAHSYHRAGAGNRPLVGCSGHCRHVARPAAIHSAAAARELCVLRRGAVVA